MEKTHWFSAPLIMLGIVLSGCASSKVWYQEGATEKQTRQDIAGCKLMAEQNGNPLAMVNLAFAFQDKSHKDAIFNDCMTAKGYSLVEKSQVPTVGSAGQNGLTTNHPAAQTIQK